MSHYEHTIEVELDDKTLEVSFQSQWQYDGEVCWNIESIMKNGVPVVNELVGVDFDKMITAIDEYLEKYWRNHGSEIENDRLEAKAEKAWENKEER